MTDQASNYDDVKRYRLDPEREQELVNTTGECVFIWANKAGHPIEFTPEMSIPFDGDKMAEGTAAAYAQFAAAGSAAGDY